MKDLNAYFECLNRHSLKRTKNVLIADLGEKKLSLWSMDELRQSFEFSFSRRPVSCQQDSLGTPWGLHEISAKHGHDAPPGMVFVGRVATGHCWQEKDEESDRGSLVTTRILRLRGLEPGLNAGAGVDSHDRYIYIHGTNRPDEFPNNISAGCLLMLDDPLIQLYDSIPQGSHLFIQRSPPA